jgi:peptidoglycan/xylan/chitin deacetylase (PgdA/CDA1 family)
MTSFMALMYHSVRNPPQGKYSISSSRLTAHLEWLSGEGYVMEGFEGLEARLRHGSFPERYVVMTFDDGHKSDLMAAEMLLKFNARATFFLTKHLCQTWNSFLDENEIKELSKLCSIGSHGVSHTSMDQLTEHEIWSELTDSKKWLEELSGHEITMFSAPGGNLTPAIRAQAQAAGYQLFGNSVEWWNKPEAVSAGRIVNRFAIRTSFSLRSFQRIVRGDVSLMLKRQLRSKFLAIPKKILSPSQLDSLRKTHLATRVL